MNDTNLLKKNTCRGTLHEKEDDLYLVLALFYINKQECSLLKVNKENGEISLFRTEDTRIRREIYSSYLDDVPE